MKKFLLLLIVPLCFFGLVKKVKADSYGYENLIEINKLCSIAKREVHSVTVLNSDIVEKSMFANTFY